MSTTESEVRFVVIDPFIKLIMELTDSEVELEDPARDVDIPISDVSDRSMIDYSVYYLKSFKAVRLLIRLTKQYQRILSAK